MEQAKIQFVLKGFSEVMGFRIFAFDGVLADRTRTAFSVKADLALARKYGIRIQELPLLCRAVLEGRDEGELRRAFTYTEEAMCRHADTAAALKESARQRKPPRRPAETAGNAWRLPSR